jgi:hypothetical protein
MRIETWFERDRAHVALLDDSDETIVEWWDNDVLELVEAGFLNPSDWKGSAIDYATHIGAL